MSGYRPDKPVGVSPEDWAAHLGWIAQQERVADFAASTTEWLSFGDLLRKFSGIPEEDLRVAVNVLVHCRVLYRVTSDDGTEMLLCTEWFRKEKA